MKFLLFLLISSTCLTQVSCATTIVCKDVTISPNEKLQFQNTIISNNRGQSLFLWIYINNSTMPMKAAKVVANLQSHIDYVSPPNQLTDDNSILAGVGFGERFYNNISGQNKRFPYVTRDGTLGSLPNTAGDFFIHAKSNSMSKLFELCQRLLDQIGRQNIAHFLDVYSFNYKLNRDLSGFIDGTANPSDPLDREMVAIDQNTGGSFAITQRWVHNLDYLRVENPGVLESFIGRTLNTSAELLNKPPTSHVARMVGGTELKRTPPFRIVRQSMPYGTISSQAGLFFIAYASSVQNFDFMLDRMVGRDPDGLNDFVMKFTRCVSGNYWFFPSINELKLYS